MMLQQTQVVRVLAKYDQFITKFPDVHALARAPLGEVLRQWSGLGYNRRAKFLHQCAQRVVTEYNGKFPDEIGSLKQLPGVGVSTSAAIMAFAYGADEPMIDTNIRRILVRTFFKSRIPSDSELYSFAKSMIPKGKGSAWNYAMLDLGATSCSARRHSADCPLTGLHGKVGDFVYKKPQSKFKHSNRYWRGKVIDQLRNNKQMTLYKLQRSLPNADRLKDILTALLSEGMINKTGRYYRLPV
jgi:A/G-specific adenine glycosylase